MKLSILFRNIFRNTSFFLPFLLIIISLILTHYFATYGKFHVFEYLVYLGIFGAGLWLIRATLLFLVPESVASCTLILVVFGSNLFYLAGVEHLLQPILLFSLYAGVLYFTASSHHSPRLVKTSFLAVISGLSILVEPTGHLVLLIPALWGIHDKTSAKEKISGIRKNYRNTLIFLACLLATIIIPVVALKISPGKIGFLDFRLPGVFILNFRYLWNNLFSFDHGWLIYTPALLIPAIGFYFLAEQYRKIFLAIFIICFAKILAESCWTTFGKTEVFGQIAYVPLIALLSLPTAFLLNVIAEKNGIIRLFIILVCVFFIGLNLFQTWQYTDGIILKSDMTPGMYCTVFGRTGFTDAEKQRMEGVEPDATLLLKDKSKFTCMVIAFYDFEDTMVSYKNQIESTYFKNGKRAFKLERSGPFSPALKLPYSELTSKKMVMARITVSVFTPVNTSFSGGSLVFSSIHEGITFRYRSLKLETLNLKPGEWHTESFDYLFPPERDPGDLLAGYVWYTGNSSLFIDDLKFELFEPKD